MSFDVVIRLRFERKENAERCVSIIHDVFGSDYIHSKIEPTKKKIEHG